MQNNVNISIFRAESLSGEVVTEPPFYVDDGVVDLGNDTDVGACNRTMNVNYSGALIYHAIIIEIMLVVVMALLFGLVLGQIVAYRRKRAHYNRLIDKI